MNWRDQIQAGADGSPHSNLLGSKFVDFDQATQTATMRFTVKKEMTTWRGGVQGGLVAETTREDGSPVRLALPDPSAALRAYAGKKVTLGIRPEALTDVEGADHRSALVERFSNTVTVTDPAVSDALSFSKRNC